MAADKPIVKAPKLPDFLEAGYPCIFLRTTEPLVAETMVRKSLHEVDMNELVFGIWKATSGLMVGKIDSLEEAMREVQRDLLDSLNWVEDVKAERPPCVVLFHNLRQFVNQYGVIQKLVDTIYRARLRGSHLIFIGPMLELPPELRNIVQFVDCPLPTREQIAVEFTTLIKVYADRLTLPKSKDEQRDLIDAAATAAVGLDSMAAENSICLSMAVAKGIDIRIIQAQKEQEVRKSDVLEFFPTDENLDTLGGFKALKAELGLWAEAFSEEAREYGLPYPKGFLIVGPAGTGKSLCAKAVASYLRLPLLRFDLGKVFRSLVGESEAAVRQALAVMEAVSPVVVWMDEIEKGMAGMSGSGELDSGVTSRVISTILTWRQETNKAVVLVATANNVATLPSMVYRKGRMDEVWATDLPNREEREEIYRIHLRKHNRDPRKFNVSVLALRTEEFVGAEIESSVIAGMFRAFKEKKEVTDKHILSAISDTIPQAQRDKEELSAIRSWVATRARLVSGGEAPKADAKSSVRKLHSKGGK